MCKNVCARAKHVQLFSHVQLSGCALELIFFWNFLFSLVVLAFICLVLYESSHAQVEARGALACACGEGNACCPLKGFKRSRATS